MNKLTPVERLILKNQLVVMDYLQLVDKPRRDRDIFFEQNRLAVQCGYTEQFLRNDITASGEEIRRKA